MQDPNGQIYWNHATAERLLPDPAQGLVWDPDRRALCLQPSAGQIAAAGTLATARDRAARPRIAVDSFGTWAFAGADGRSVLAGMPHAPDVVIWTAPADWDAGLVIRDLDWTPEGHLLVALTDAAGQGRLVWLDRLLRFDPVVLAEAGFAPQRICLCPLQGGAWLVDRDRAKVRWLTGTPIPDVLDRLRHAGDAFVPRPDMANPPRLERPVMDATVQTGLTGAEIIDAIADDTGALVLLRFGVGATDPAILQRVAAGGETSHSALSGVIRPFTLTLIAPHQVALACDGWTEARAFDLTMTQDTLLPLGGRYPLRDWTGGRFCSGAMAQPHYPIASPKTTVRRLAALSFATYAPSGQSDLPLIDTGTEGFVWHRLYLEAALPKGTAIQVLLAASDRAEDLQPIAQRTEWHRHHFGAAGGANVPHGVWLDANSERPWGKSALHCPRQRDRAGLFTALIQTTGDDVINHRLAGRYLSIRVVLDGTGAATPRLNALRVWGPRFSWRDRYLPELYRIATGPGAKGSDFLDRYLAMFESFLTPLEGEVAMLHRLANPRTIPAEGLDWLAAWLGLTPDSALGEAATRRLIGTAARLAEWRGTLRGLQGALDVASDGGVAQGRIVVVEHFRMQRTFATILGADYSDRLDPLTRGSGSNGNSQLGPGFYLGAEDEKRLFALFRPDILNHDLTSPDDRAQALRQMQDISDEAAHRVTVLIHDETDPDRLALLSRVISRESPAHVQTAMHLAPGTMLLGLQALLGVETWAGPQPEPQPMTLGQTRIGQGRLRGQPALGQRLTGAPS